jgi:hypothetical protein
MVRMAVDVSGLLALNRQSSGGDSALAEAPLSPDWCILGNTACCKGQQVHVLAGTGVLAYLPAER